MATSAPHLNWMRNQQGPFKGFKHCTTPNSKRGVHQVALCMAIPAHLVVASHTQPIYLCISRKAGTLDRSSIQFHRSKPIATVQPFSASLAKGTRVLMNLPP